MQNKNILLETQYADEKKFQQRMSMHKYGDQKKTQWEWMADIYQLKSYKEILDIGCGDGNFWLAMKNKTLPQQNIILADISQGMLDAAKIQLSPQNTAGAFVFEIADIESLPYSDQTFDLVLAHMMLYHAKSPLDALKEVKRVLKTDGTLGLSVLSIRTGKEYLSLANKLEPKIPPITAASRFTEEEY